MDMMFPEVQLCSAQWVYIAVIVVILVYWKTRQPKYNLPPGPRGWPIIGNLLSLQGESGMDIVLMEMAKKYGPILTLHIGLRQTFIISNYELAMEALVKNMNDISGRPSYATAVWLSDGFRNIDSSDPSPAWRLQRKIAAKAFRNYLSGKQLEAKLHSSLNNLIKLIRSEKTAFDLSDYLTFSFYNLFAGFCGWQGSYTFEDPGFRLIIQSMNMINANIGGGLLEDDIDFLKYLPSKPRRIAKREFGKIMDFLYQTIRQQRTSFNRDEPRHLIDELLLAQSQADQDEVNALLTDVHIAHAVLDILLAGFETSRHTIYWCLLYMAAYPDVQTRVQDEIDGVLGQNRLPCFSDREALPYTDATLHEIMRIRPLAPLGSTRKCLRQTTVGGYDIPKGSDVVVSIWALHHDPVYWESPDQFNPDRFLQDGHLVPKRDSFMPFSAGRRICIGESVSKPELFVVFAGLLQHFRVESTGNVNLKPLPELEFAMAIYRRTKLFMKSRF